MLFSDGVRNARLDALETAIGTAPILRILTGSAPAATTDASTGTLLVEMVLPSDWMAAASGGAKAKLGTWEDASANGDGVATYFRIFDSGDTTCHIQGSVGQGSGELQLDNTNIATGQQVTITAFTLTDGNGNP